MDNATRTSGSSQSTHGDLAESGRRPSPIVAARAQQEWTTGSFNFNRRSVDGNGVREHRRIRRGQIDDQPTVGLADRYPLLERRFGQEGQPDPAKGEAARGTFRSPMRPFIRTPLATCPTTGPMAL
jgi:hypothetical protein